MITLAFIAVPYVYAFGTGNNYWNTASSAGLFWLLAGLVFVVPIARSEKKWTVFLPLVLAAQAIVVVLMQTGLEKPYRQTQALRLNDHPVEIGKPGSLLVLSEGYAKYLAEAMASAASGGT